VIGNSCERGFAYGLAEVNHPTRTLTTTVRIDGAMHCRLPVKTSKPIPKEEMMNLCSCTGGLSNYFGTSNSTEIHKLVEQKDPKAVRVWNAMIYQVCKSIGSMATVLQGKVDGILLTGGLVRFKDIVEGIQKRCSFLGKISCYPGEVEQETLAQGVLDVFNGKITPAKYTGVPVFNGF
jgi:butyrate kinase